MPGPIYFSLTLLSHEQPRVGGFHPYARPPPSWTCMCQCAMWNFVPRPVHAPYQFGRRLTSGLTVANLIASTRTVFTVTSLDLGSMYLYIFIYCNGIPALYFEWAYVSRRGRPDVACAYYARDSSNYRSALLTRNFHAHVRTCVVANPTARSIDQATRRYMCGQNVSSEDAMHARSHTPNIAATERHDLCVHIFEHRRSI